MTQLKGLLRLLDENEAIFVESLGKDLRKPYQAGVKLPQSSLPLPVVFSYSAKF
jgi:hypothetical protein